MGMPLGGHAAITDRKGMPKQKACGHLWVISAIGNIKVCVECGERAVAFPDKRGQQET